MKTITNEDLIKIDALVAGAVLEKKRAVKFMHLASKNQCMIASEMSQKIKDIILSYGDQIPLALAVGVLEVVKKEIIEDNT